jgi:hypothetical protein
VADQEYKNICISFSIDPGASDTFQPGSYRAEFYFNNTPAGSTTFTIGGG